MLNGLPWKGTEIIPVATMDLTGSTMAVTDCAGSMAERSYPTPKVGVATESARLGWHRSGRKWSYPMAEVRDSGQEEHPTSKEQLQGCRRAERSLSTFKVRRGNSSKVRSSGCALLEQL